MKVKAENPKNNSILYQLRRTVLGTTAKATQKVLDAWGDFIKEKEGMDRRDDTTRQKRLNAETANRKVEVVPDKEALLRMLNNR